MLKDKVAVITGAGSGIGRETAMAFAKEGALVVVADINITSGNETVEYISQAGYSSQFVQVDVSSEESVKRMMDYAGKLTGRIDVLVNNAGLEFFTKIEDTTMEQWEKTMDVNLKGVFLGLKHVAPYMKKQKKGSIINMASIAGISAWPGLGVYSAAKGGVVLLSKAAAAEYGKYGIRVNSICPGSIRTPLLEEQFFGAAEDPVKAETDLLKHYPLGRIGTPQEIAEAAVFLGSDRASFITGQSLHIDGGLGSYVGDLI